MRNLSKISTVSPLWNSGGDTIIWYGRNIFIRIPFLSYFVLFFGGGLLAVGREEKAKIP